MMGNVNKTDKLDAKGLAKLLHLDSLPTVWLPPGEIRDERELHRTRMALSKLRTALTSSRCPSGRTASMPP
jgi:transposase